MQRHQPGEPTNEGIEPEELKKLLDRLDPLEDHPLEKPDYHATVSAVCEATCHPSHRVWEALHEIRREDLESRVTQVLAELEEPLYRVERPSQTHDSLSRTTWSGRCRTLESVLDKLPRPDRPRAARRLPKETKSDRVGTIVGNVILVFFAALFVVLIVFCLLKIGSFR